MQKTHTNTNNKHWGGPPCDIRMCSWSTVEWQRLRAALPSKPWTQERGPCPLAIASRPLLANAGTAKRNAGGWPEGKEPDHVVIRAPCVHKAGGGNNIQNNQQNKSGGRRWPPAGHPLVHPTGCQIHGFATHHQMTSQLLSGKLFRLCLCVDFCRGRFGDRGVYMRFPNSL